MAENEVDETWRNALRPKIQLINSIFNTHDGEQFFQLLVDTFDRTNIRGADTHETYYRLGQRDVVQYLRELREAAARELPTNEKPIDN